MKFRYPPDLTLSLLRASVPQRRRSRYEPSIFPSDQCQAPSLPWIESQGIFAPGAGSIVASDRPYHYMGSGRFFVRFGDALAGAMVKLLKKQK